MSVGKLYGVKYFRLHKPLVAAKFAGVEVDYNPNFKFGVDNVTPEFKKNFPLGQIPAFLSADGNFTLVEIAYMSKDPNFIGGNLAEKSKIDQYILHSETQLAPAAEYITLPILGYVEYEEKHHKWFLDRLKKSLEFLDAELTGKKYLLGDKPTIADVVVAINMENAYKLYMDEEFRNQYPNVTKYFTDFYSLPEVKDVVGTLELCKQTPKFT